MLSRSISIILLLLISSTWCLGQSIDDSNINLTQKNIGKNILQSTKESDLRSTYLGKITDKDGKVKFYVVKEFSRIKAAIIYHGNSRLIFYNADKKFKAQYHFDMPDELPVKLNANTLYFIDKDQKPAKTLTLSINGQLPEQILNSHQVSFTK